MESEQSHRLDVPWYVTDDQFVQQMKLVSSHIQELNCSRCTNLTHEAFIQLSREGIIFPCLKRLSIPASSPFPNLVYECLSAILPALEELENIRPNSNNTCDPLKCQAYFKRSMMKVLHDMPSSSYGRISKSLPEASDKQKRVKWESDLAKTAISCNHIESYQCVRGNGYMDDKGMERLSVLFPGLRFLELQHCSISDEAFTKFFTYNRSGRVSSIILDKPGEEVTDKSLKLIADNCPNLERLKVSRCSRVTNAGFKYLVQKCWKLVELDLNNFCQSSNLQKTTSAREELDNSSLATIGKNCKFLEGFSLHYTSAVNTEGLAKLQMGCSGLKNLMLYECQQVDDTSVEVLKQFTALKTLALVNCSKISPKGVVNLIIKVPDLQQLTLFCNNKAFFADVAPLAEEAYKMLSSEMGRFKLNMLDMLITQGIGGTFLRLLTVLCSQLTSLDLRDSDQINSDDLIEVVMTCERLRNLDLSFSAARLTDDFLKAVGHHAANLCHLALGTGVKMLSQEALVNVIKVAPSLETLSLDLGSMSIDELHLVRIAEQFHEGKCHIYVDNSKMSDGVHRNVMLQFKPIKSVNTSSADWW